VLPSSKLSISSARIETRSVDPSWNSMICILMLYTLQGKMSRMWGQIQETYMRTVLTTPPLSALGPPAIRRTHRPVHLFGWTLTLKFRLRLRRKP